MIRSGKMKDVFLIAGLLTAIIFIIGLAIGTWLDNMRVEEINQRLTQIEADWNDARIQSLYYQTMHNDSKSCDAAISANFDFNERIYQEGVQIDRAETVNRFAPSVVMEKKRYVLLLLQFWLNGVNLRKICNANYSTILYFYSNFDESFRVQQSVQSAALVDLIHSCGRKVLAIPLPIDMDITTINIIKSQYNITVVPSLLINEKIILPGLQSEEDIEKYVKC